MDSMPKVSVMIPVYNAKEFIVECLESILSQDYPNIELVVSDDCSTDGTQEVLKRYEGDGRVKLFLNKKNLGITDNCNQALSSCNGTYVCFFAGDDVMLPNKISAQVALLEKHNEASMCYHCVDVFDSDSGETLYVTEFNRRTIFSFFDMIEKGGLPGINSVIARRNCLPAKLYDKDFPVVSDWLFMVEIALRGKVVFIDEIYTKYRKHVGGVSAQADDLIDETLRTLNHIEDRFNGDLRIVSVCKQSRKRYLLGSLFRAISIPNRGLLGKLRLRFFENGNFIIATLICLYEGTVLYVQPLNKMVCFFIRKGFGR